MWLRSSVILHYYVFIQVHQVSPDLDLQVLEEMMAHQDLQEASELLDKQARLDHRAFATAAEAARVFPNNQVNCCFLCELFLLRCPLTVVLFFSAYPEEEYYGYEP